MGLRLKHKLELFQQFFIYRLFFVYVYITIFDSIEKLTEYYLFKPLTYHDASAIFSSVISLNVSRVNVPR